MTEISLRRDESVPTGGSNAVSNAGGAGPGAGGGADWGARGADRGLSGGSSGGTGAQTPPASARPQEIEFLPMNFTISLETRLAALAGLPSYLVRAKQTELELERFWEQVALLNASLKISFPVRHQFASEWKAAVDRLDFSKVNKVVAGYNEYFPIEANLPMDARLGDFVYRGAQFIRMTAPTRAEVLERFPADSAD